MKITIVGHHPFPIAKPFAGGLEMQTHVLAKGLINAGHEVTLYAHKQSDPLLNIRPYKEEVISFEELQKIPVNPAFNDEFIQQHHTYMDAMCEIADSDADIVHLNCLHYVPFTMSSIIKKPIIASLHTPPLAFLQSAILAEQNNKNIHYTAVSASLSGIWNRYAPDSEVIYNGVDPEKWEFNLQQPEDSLFWAGRICPEKGTREAILAAKKAGNPLRFAGPINDSYYFDSKIKPLLSDEIIYLGHIGPDEMAKELARSKGMLFTSLWEEPFGMVLIESMACGVPVVAFNSGAVEEVLSKDTGFIVNKSDVDAMAGCIQRLDEINRYDCRKRVLDHFTCDKMVENYIESYGKLIDKQSRIAAA